MRLIEQRPWWIAGAILVLVVAWMATGALRSDTAAPEASADPPDRRPEVVVSRQRAEPVTRHVRIYGRTEPARSVGIRAETRGRVAALHADRGERVAAGTLLVELDERDRRARLTEARSLVRQREAEFEGRKRLGGEGFVSALQLAEAEAQLEQARAELRRAELDLEHMRVRAPFDGAIQDRTVEVGDFLDPGDAVLTFVDIDTLVAIANVAEQEIGLVRPGQPGSARLITGESIEGKVRYIAPVADPATRTFVVELEFDNRERMLRSGVTAEIELPAGETRAQRVSPALLTLDDEGTLGIKLLDEDDRVVFVPARIVHSTPSAVWLAGLPEDAAIITRGQGFVQPGQQVVSVPADTAPASTGARR